MSYLVQEHFGASGKFFTSSATCRQFLARPMTVLLLLVCSLSIETFSIILCTSTAIPKHRPSGPAAAPSGDLSSIKSVASTKSDFGDLPLKISSWDTGFGNAVIEFSWTRRFKGLT